MHACTACPVNLLTKTCLDPYLYSQKLRFAVTASTPPVLFPESSNGVHTHFEGTSVPWTLVINHILKSSGALNSELSHWLDSSENWMAISWALLVQVHWWENNLLALWLFLGTIPGWHNRVVDEYVSECPSNVHATQPSSVLEPKFGLHSLTIVLSSRKHSSVLSIKPSERLLQVQRIQRARLTSEKSSSWEQASVPRQEPSQLTFQTPVRFMRHKLKQGEFWVSTGECGSVNYSFRFAHLAEVHAKLQEANTWLVWAGSKWIDPCFEKKQVRHQQHMWPIYTLTHCLYETPTMQMFQVHELRKCSCSFLCRMWEQLQLLCCFFGLSAHEIPPFFLVVWKHLSTRSWTKWWHVGNVSLIQTTFVQFVQESSIPSQFNSFVQRSSTRPWINRRLDDSTAPKHE